MPNIVSPVAGTTIANIGSGAATDEFQRWIEAVTRNDLLVGSGSPEGVVVATVGREYMDTSGTAGAIKYIKRDADIAGDRSNGWILV